MKAAVLEELNAPLALREVECPEPDYGQVRVDVICSGLCGAQLQEIAGLKGNAGHLPHLLGHEGCGIVRQLGVGVTQVALGDKVVMHWRQGAGIESALPSYRIGETRARIGAGRVVTLAGQVVVSENRLTRVPPNTPPELCALLGCGLSTALMTVEHEAQVQFGESVMIVGCGGVGLNLIRAASLAQACPIIAVDAVEGKGAAALHAGATQFLNIVDDHRTMARLNNIDVIIDTSGHPTALEVTVQLLSGRGRYIMVGQPKPNESFSFTNARHFFEGEGKTLKATQGGGFRPHVDLPRYIRLHEHGRLALDGVISHRLPLAKVNEAIDLVRVGLAGRILIEMP